MPISSRQDENFMRLAIAKARQGVAKGQTPFGAVIVYRGKPVAAAHNQVWRRTDITAHAEMTALRQACRRLKTLHLSGATVYSTCEPCPMCLSACHWARIGRIVYGASISDAAGFGFNELRISNQTMLRLGKSRIRLAPGVLRGDCLQVFGEWKRKHPKAY
ncbi:MAG: nucleoside deaminase [candidate division FCPU426 bacterium]